MANKNEWIADRRLYLDKAGKVVEADSPDRATLLVAAGNTIPLDRARELGLVDEAGATVQAQALGGAAGDEPALEGGERKAGPDDPEGAFAYLGEGEAGSPEKKTPANKAKRPGETKDGTNTPAPTEDR